MISNLSDFQQNFLSAWSQRTVGNSARSRVENESRAQTDEGTQPDNGESGAIDVSGTEAVAEELTIHREASAPSNTSEHMVHRVVIGNFPGPQRFLFVCVENEQLDVPILYNNMMDSALLEQFRMFYRYLKVKRGLVELIIPRTLVGIDCIKACSDPWFVGHCTDP